MDVEILKQITHNVFLVKYENREFLVTKSRFKPHYGERKFSDFREWIPYRSKLAAMILNGYTIDFRPEIKMLYLGAASGTTVSHLSDIVERGYIYAVEYSARPFKKFLELALERRNIIPLLKDASKPEEYAGIVEKVDFIYQDIAQKNQNEIFAKNAEFFLKNGGEGLIMVKARSIDSVAEPSGVFNRVLSELEENFSILKHGKLDPFHRDHIFVHVKF
ncbi:fibrillarin-like rRNA/tRNA 2'-O-methyltransferase [Archaeoglobales archaeon]|nr:MAG: fibrillarin-like rRNA/tRNA 2'-O-methyltransferase [Archaeoglobales archaeon]